MTATITDAIWLDEATDPGVVLAFLSDGHTQLLQGEAQPSDCIDRVIVCARCVALAAQFEREAAVLLA